MSCIYSIEGDWHRIQGKVKKTPKKQFFFSSFRDNLVKATFSLNCHFFKRKKRGKKKFRFDSFSLFRLHRSFLNIPKMSFFKGKKPFSISNVDKLFFPFEKEMLIKIFGDCFLWTPMDCLSTWSIWERILTFGRSNQRIKIVKKTNKST